jgi:hypothetical protein
MKYAGIYISHKCGKIGSRAKNNSENRAVTQTNPIKMVMPTVVDIYQTGRDKQTDMQADR